MSRERGICSASPGGQMRKRPLLLLSTLLLLSLIAPSKTPLAAPQLQQANQTLQILLVLDVSGSMSTPVYTGIVPEDLLSLLLRLDEITKDPEYLDLIQRIEQIDPYFSSLNDLKEQLIKTFSDYFLMQKNG